MSVNKGDKVAKILLAGAGIGVGIFLITKYHKNIYNKLTKAKNLILYDIAKIQRKNFDVHIISDPKYCDSIIKKLREHCNNYNVLGFDAEWVTVNNERRKVALIQLCSAEGLCVLFRICKFNKIPLELRTLLEDPDIIKLGVQPIDDAKKLLQDYAIKVNGTFDIRFLALLANHKAEGLAKLSKAILDIELDKNWRITCSDWEATALSSSQIDYAAKDAFVAIEIFKKLYHTIRPNMNDSPSILKFCDQYTDISFKNKLAQMNLSPGSSEFKISNLNKRQKDINKLLKRSYATRTNPLYDNCYLLAPDNTLLCTLDKRKAEWYITKGLGTEVSRDESILTVRLNFEPKGRAVGEVGEYYQTVKENKCVVCGKESDLIRKNVVPHEYRKYFPTVMKDKTSHDVLLLCIHCHQISNMSDMKIRKKLEEKCNAPIFEPPINAQELIQLRSIKRSARALVKNSGKIPEERKSDLRKIVQEAYPNDELSDEFLNKVAFEKEPEAENKTSHGELVVEYFKANEGLIALEKVYRQHFLDVMEPKFMPKFWDVNHNANRLEIRAMENRVDVEDLKVAGVDEKIIQNMQPAKFVESVPNGSLIVDDEVDNASMLSFHSAAGTLYSNSSRKLDRTEDDQYFSDSATVASFYETIRSGDSTQDLTDFRSFENSTEQLYNPDEDDSDATIGSPDFLSDSGSDTEVEEIAAK